MAEHEAQQIVREHEVEPERVDISSLDKNRLADIMRGGTLFAEYRTIILHNLSERKDVWDTFGEWASDLPKETTIILVESKPDKRTKTYKTLAKIAKIIPVDMWTDRQGHLANGWFAKLAKEKKVVLSAAHVHDMVQRATVPGEKPGLRYIDQMLLDASLLSLSSLDEVTDEAISTVLPPATRDTVFDLLKHAIGREPHRLAECLAELKLSAESQYVFVVVSNQWAQLVSVALARGVSADAAGELGIHPYAASQLQTLSVDLDRDELREFTALCADLDAKLKNSEVQPWIAVERFLMAIALR